MKIHRTLALPILAFVLGAIGIGAVLPAQAQTKRPPAEVKKDYDAFIAKFRVALKANDAGAVTEMTKFPFLAGEMRDAAYFRANLYGKIFTPKVRTCLQRAKGVYDRAPDGSENFTAFCGEDLYLFTRTKDGFRFAEAGVND